MLWLQCNINVIILITKRILMKIKYCEHTGVPYAGTCECACFGLVTIVL